MVSMFLLSCFYLLFLLPVTLSTTFEAPVYSLDLTGLHSRIRADGTCTSGEVCRYDTTRGSLDCEECNATSFLPQSVIDGSRRTKWVSIPSSFSTPSLTLYLDKQYNISGVELLSKRLPLSWTVDYSTDNVGFSPWAAVVSKDDECSNFTMYQLCGTTPSQVDIHTLSLEAGIDLKDLPMPNALKFNFLLPTEPFTSDPREEFYEVEEISVTVVCEDAVTLFNSTSGNCPGVNRVYSPLISLPATVKFSGAQTQLSWSQKGEPPISPLGAWYLDDVIVSNTNGNGFNDSFESNQTDPTVWSVDGARLHSAPCSADQLDQVLLFSERTGSNRSRGAILTNEQEIGRVQFVLGFLDPSLQCGNEFGEVELSHCSANGEECQLVGVFVLNDCGDCVNRHHLRLRQYITRINNSLSQLTPPLLIVANQTDLKLILDEQAALEKLLFDWLLGLTAIERNYGFPSEYPRNITLPTHIATIEISTSVLNLFTRLCGLLDNLTMFDNVRNMSIELLEHSNVLVERVRELRNEEIYLQPKISALARNLSVLSSQLCDIFDEISLALLQANSSLNTIISRQRTYDSLEREIDRLIVLFTETSLDIYRYTELVQRHTESLRNITNRLVLSRDHLEAVVNVSVGIITDSEGVQLRIDQAENYLSEVQELLSKAESLPTVIEENLSSARHSFNLTSYILDSTNRTIQTSDDLLESLDVTVSELTARTNSYSSELERFIPEAYPSPCTLGSEGNITCLPGELHAKLLEQNSSRISSESTATRLYAHDFLDNVKGNRTIDLEGIRSIKDEATRITDIVVLGLQRNNLSQLVLEVAETDAEVQTLSLNVSSVLDESRAVLSDVNTEFNRSISLQQELRGIEDDLSSIQSGITELENTQNYTAEAELLSNRASAVLNTLNLVNSTLQRVVEDVPVIEEQVREVESVVRDTEVILEQAEEEAVGIQEFITATQQTLDQAGTGLNDTIKQNDEIISDIDSLLSLVDDTHLVLKKINAPAYLEDSIPNQFVSLQPPPGVDRSQEEIQFDSLEIYMFDEGDPTGILFYAGPLVEEGTQGNDSALANEDYLAILTSRTEVSVEWRLGQSRNSFKLADQAIDNEVEVYLRRAGSMFNVILGPDFEDQKTTTNRTLVQDSLLFKQTQNTAYLVGGKPPNAKLALTDYQRYDKSLSGTINLILYGGRVWSLWDYRRRSETETSDWTYHNHAGPRGNTIEPQADYMLSFDGNGYLRPKQFHSFDATLTARAVIFEFFFIPQGFDGLIVHLYDPNVNVSIEVALYNGEVRLVMKDNTYEYINSIKKVSDSTNTLKLEYRESARKVRVEDNNDLVYDISWFNNLANIQAWFGGVVESQLDIPERFRPGITTERFHGCVDLVIKTGNTERLVLDDSEFFRRNYLGSPIQKGMSAVCIKSSYADQVSFNGSGYLSYKSLQLADIGGRTTTQFNFNPLTLSLSFLPLSDNTVLFAAVDNNKRIVVKLENGRVVASVSESGQSLTLSSKQTADLRQWHHLVLDIREGLRLFVDDREEDSGSLAGFTFSLPLESGNDPVLHVGGAPNSLSPGAAPFVGCLKDFAFNFDAMKFFSAAIDFDQDREGISFFECPFTPDQTQSSLPLVFSEPEPRTCGSVSEPEYFNNTIGGFHALSQAFSYNIFPLQSSVWSVQLMLRRYSGDGHVITFPSDDITISLFIENGGIKWYLLKKNGANSSSITRPIPSGKWHGVSLDCNGTTPYLVCVSSVDGSEDDTFSLVADRAGFVPELPVTLGRTEQSKGFVGCLRDLSINGRSSGYDLEELSTCEECYADPIDGWGLTGIGYLMKSVSSQSNPIEYHISFSFKPRKAYGLLMYLSNASPRSPLFAMGLYNGELRLTNFSQNGSYITQTDQVLCSVETVLLYFHNISVDVSGSSVTVSLTTATGQLSSMMIQTVTMATNDLNIYIGGVEDEFEDVRLFGFLLTGGETMLSSGVVPKFTGCLRMVEVSRGTNSPNLLTRVTDADHYEDVFEGLCPS